MTPKYFTVAYFFLLSSLVVLSVSAIESDWCIVGGFEEEASCTMYEYCTGTSGYNWTCPDSNDGCQWVDHYTLYNPDWAIMTGDDSAIYPSGCAYGDCNLVFFNSSESACVTPTPTPTPSENCVTKCGYTWTQGFTSDDVLLDMCIWSVTPLNACQMCSWQMEMMQNQYPCAVPPSPVPTYDPTPMPTVPPPPTIPTIVPGPEPPVQIVSIGDTDIHDVDFTVATIATIAVPSWNNTLERQNITSLVGNMTDPYLNAVDAFSVAMSLSIQHILYIPNWVMASVYTTVQPIAVAFAEIIVIVSEWGSVPLQLMRLALDNTPAGIQALLIYGVCLEMVIYLLRGET